MDQSNELFTLTLPQAQNYLEFASSIKIPSSPSDSEYEAAKSLHSFKTFMKMCINAKFEVITIPKHHRHTYFILTQTIRAMLALQKK